MPSAARVLSAIWMQSSALDGGPSLLTGAEPNPELDVEETFDYTKMNIATHVWPDNTEVTHRRFGGHAYPVGVDISRDYHTYGVERRDGQLRFYFDRHLAWETKPGDPSLWRMSRHMVLSLEGHLGPQSSIDSRRVLTSTTCALGTPPTRHWSPATTG
ncbi:glycosyl hydrolase family protein [Cutibacterium acnes JCM 18918]|nr:glycosyl hydrolase family protein [Cutibacterium acnes JCM 18918]